MSLIQEALKRQLEEQSGQTYTPPPLPPVKPQRGQAAGKVFRALFAVVFLVLVAGSLFYLSTRNWSWQEALKAAKKDVESASQRVASRSAEPEPAAANEPKITVKSGSSVSSSQSSPLSGVHLQVNKMKAAVKESQKDLAAAEQPIVPSPTAAAAEVSAASGGAPVSAPAPAAAAAPAVATAPISTPPPAPAPEVKGSESSGLLGSSRHSVRWPKVTVNGIMASGRLRGAAMVNNRMVGAGEWVGDVRIVEVQAKGVVMEYGKETRLILIGQTTD